MGIPLENTTLYAFQLADDQVVLPACGHIRSYIQKSQDNADNTQVACSSRVSR